MFKMYVELGWEHIISWGAADHILFVVALASIYTLKDWKAVLVLVTAFTIGHSLTLALSAFNIVRFNTRWVEFLIPCTIIVTALANLFQKKFSPQNFRLNYWLALFFGLIHGMGFANGLSSLLGRGESKLVPLLGFNLGLEAGQVTVVAGLLLLGWIFLNLVKVNRREWVVFFSGGAFMVAFTMALSRWPG